MLAICYGIVHGKIDDEDMNLFLSYKQRGFFIYLRLNSALNPIFISFASLICSRFKEISEWMEGIEASMAKVKDQVDSAEDFETLTNEFRVRPFLNAFLTKDLLFFPPPCLIVIRSSARNCAKPSKCARRT